MLSKTVSFLLVFCPGGPRTWDIGRDIWVGRGHCNSVGGPPSPGVCGEYNGWRQWPAAPGLLGHSILSLSGLMMWSRLMENITTCLQQSLYYTKNCGIYVVWRFFSEETRTQSCRVARSEWYKCLTLCIGGWFRIIADLLNQFLITLSRGEVDWWAGGVIFLLFQPTAVPLLQRRSVWSWSFSVWTTG